MLLGVGELTYADMTGTSRDGVELLKFSKSNICTSGGSRLSVVAMIGRGWTSRVYIVSNMMLYDILVHTMSYFFLGGPKKQFPLP